MPSERNLALIKTIKKIPLFKGLSPKQVQALLAICRPETYEPGERICGSQAQSNEMFILISGALIVKTADGVQVATVEPVTTVGEIGVVMRQPRSATVEAAVESNAFVIPRNQFELLLQKDVEMQVKVFRNIIEIVSGKILNDNVRTRDYELERLRLQKLMRDREKTSEIAMELAMKHSGMSRAEVETHVADEKRDSFLEILIVDDEPEIRRFAKEALSDASVTEASDGKEAFDAICERRPDLVITDIRMPKMDGYTLLSNVRELFPDLPVLAISGFVNEAETEGHDFNGFIEKGAIDLHEFRQTIGKTVGRELS